MHQKAWHNATSERFVAILDAAGYQLTKGPSLSVIKEVILTLRYHFPYTIQGVYILNTSQAFRLVFKLLKPILSGKLLSKLAVVSDVHEVDRLVGLENMELSYGGSLPDQFAA